MGCKLMYLDPYNGVYEDYGVIGTPINDHLCIGDIVKFTVKSKVKGYEDSYSKVGVIYLSSSQRRGNFPAIYGYGNKDIVTGKGDNSYDITVDEVLVKGRNIDNETLHALVSNSLYLC